MKWFSDYFNDRCEAGVNLSLRESNKWYDKGGNMTPERMRKWFDKLEKQLKSNI
jgi:ribonuclease I